MNVEIQEILEQEERRIEEADRVHSIRPYTTCPSGLREIRRQSLRQLPVAELAAWAERSEFKDLDVLKVLFDAYVRTVPGYIQRVTITEEIL